MSLYPFPNQRYTSQLGLALYGMDEVLAENMLLIDGTFSAGSTINVNSVLVSAPNFNNTTPAAPLGDTNVVWQVDINGNVSAYVPSSGGGAVSSVFGRTGAVVAVSGDYSYAQISGTPQLPVTVAAVTSNWLNSYNAATGLFTATQPNYTDIAGTVPTPPSGSVLWSAIGNAAAALTLANANYATTFNQTSAVAWTWANTTVATVATTNASPLLELAANYWATGGATGVDLWTVGIAALTAGLNSPSTLTFTHTGSTGSAAVRVPLLNIGGTDAGISRLGAASLAIGNGTAGDFTGSLKLGTALIIAPDTSYSTKALNVRNNGNTLSMFDVTDDGRVNIGTDAGSNYFLNVSIPSGDASGKGLAEFAFLNLTGTPSVQLQGSASFGPASEPSFIWGTNNCTFAIGNNSTYNVEFVKTTAGKFYLQYQRPWGAGGDILTIAPQTFTSGNFINFNINNGTPLFAVDYTGTAKWNADSGISRLGAASLAIGNGTAGNTTGQITATTFTVAASGAAPTSAGTAGTVGQIITNGGKLYFCSATGAAGAATWNTITLVSIP